MSDSSLSLAAGSRQPDTGLILRPLFKSLPSGVVTDAFRKHVDGTGSPETFEWISTTRPPDTGQLRVLTRFRAERGKRPRGDLAPCPICSPSDPQYLMGLLVWCEATAAIYAIGMECGRTLDREARLDDALIAYDRQEARRRLEDRLFAKLPSVPELRQWIATHLPAAAAADRLSRGFRRRVPRVYAVVRKAFGRHGELPVRQAPGDPAPEPTRIIIGAGFLKTAFGAEARLRAVDERLSHLDNGDDELECIDAIGKMPEAELVKALKWLKAAERDVANTFAHLSECAAFLTPDNMATLAKWSETQGAPFRLMAYAEHRGGGRVKVFLYQDRSDWGDTLDGFAAAPEPPPAL